MHASYSVSKRKSPLKRRRLFGLFGAGIISKRPTRIGLLTYLTRNSQHHLRGRIK